MKKYEIYKNIHKLNSDNQNPNPFISDSKGLTCNTLTKVIVSDVKTNNNIKNVGHFHTLFVESDKFTKIYDGCYQSLRGVNKHAYDLFGYICDGVEFNNDIVVLDYKEVVKEIKSFRTRPLYQVAVKQLKDLHIIHKKEQTQHLYYINPFYIFKGSRPKFFELNYPELLIEKDNKTVKQSIEDLNISRVRRTKDGISLETYECIEE